MAAFRLSRKSAWIVNLRLKLHAVFFRLRRKACSGKLKTTVLHGCRTFHFWLTYSSLTHQSSGILCVASVFIGTAQPIIVFHIHNPYPYPYPYIRLKIKLTHRNMSTKDKPMIKQTKATKSVFISLAVKTSNLCVCLCILTLFCSCACFATIWLWNKDVYISLKWF